MISLWQRKCSPKKAMLKIYNCIFTLISVLIYRNMHMHTYFHIYAYISGFNKAEYHLISSDNVIFTFSNHY